GGVGGGEAERLLVGGGDRAAAGLVDPVRQALLTAQHEGELELPGVVLALPGVPGRVAGLQLVRADPLGDQVAQDRAGSGVARPAHRGALRLLRPVFALLQYRALDPADALAGDPGEFGDRLRRLAGADPGLDFLWAQRILHFDLVLAEPGELAADGGAESVVDGQREAGAAAGAGQHQVGAVLADGHEAKLLHRPPFRVPAEGGASAFPRVLSLMRSAVFGQYPARHVRTAACRSRGCAPPRRPTVPECPSWHGGGGGRRRRRT